MPKRDVCTDSLLAPSSSAAFRIPTPSSNMAFFNASASASLSSERSASDEHQRWFQTPSFASRRKSRALASLHRTLSTPSSSSSTNSHRPPRSSRRPSRSHTCPSRESYSSYRSLRTASSPSRVGFLSPRRNLFKISRLNQNISASFDFTFKSQHSDIPNRQSIRLPSISSQNFSENCLNGNLDDSFLASNSSQNSLSASGSNARVGRSISSPGLQPARVSCPSALYPHSPTSPRRFRYTAITHSQDQILERTTTIPMSTILPSPSVSYLEDSNQAVPEGGVDNSFPVQRMSASLESSLNSSRNSMRNNYDNDTPLGATNESLFGRHIPNTTSATEGSSFWPGEPSVGVSLRLQGGATEERPRLSQLALAHLTSRDLSSIRFQSPPPSYEKLCNPEALPTYREALEGKRGEKRHHEHTMIFTLPSAAEYSGASPLDPLLEDNERNARGGLWASLAAELSDSEGGYTTILDAIPQHPIRDPCPEVPIRFVPRCSFRRLRRPRFQSPCVASVCNKDLVKKELNRRWPFIIYAREDDRCPGLILIECSSNLAVAQLPESQSTSDAAAASNTSENPFPSTSAAGELPSYTEGDWRSGQMSPELGPLDVESAGLNPHVMFYLCGKCVNFDSFDVDSVRTHLEYDCTGSVNKWSNMSEMYLVMRALCFVSIIILVLMWLPLGRY